MSSFVEIIGMEYASNEEGVVRDVVVLGAESKNRRKYTPEAMKAAAPMYEGAMVFINHGSRGKPRISEERFASLHGVRYDAATNKIKASEMRYLKTHPMAQRVKEDLDRKLGFFGLSHVFNGEGRVDSNGVTIVNSISSVESVDLVTNPGTTLSLTEQLQTMQTQLKGSEAELAEAEPADATVEAQPADPNARIAELENQVKSLAEIVQQLMEKLTGGEQTKPAKFIKPKSGQVVAGAEHTKPADKLPTDPKELAKWLRSAN